MLLIWLWQLRPANAGVADVGWTMLVSGLAVLDAVLGPGLAIRRAAIAAVMAIWGARLSVYLLRARVLGRPENGRYQDLRRHWGGRSGARFFWFFEAQAAAAVFFSLPALVASLNRAATMSVVELGAMVLWVAAFIGELSADRQLERFRASPADRERTCQVGLWRYSRHPNYFFEWAMWVAYGLFASASPWGWVAFACPLVMLYLLFKVTGIPAIEAQAIRSRGEEYRRYQRTTNVFVPWLPRRTRRTP
jgi:steroid 5-alpha reductase family enzyme